MAFPIPWAYRVSGFMPQPYLQSHALVGQLTYLRSCFVCGSFVAGGADPGRGAERLSERFFGMGPDAKKRIRSRVLRDVA